MIETPASLSHTALRDLAAALRIGAIDLSDPAFSGLSGRIRSEMMADARALLSALNSAGLSGEAAAELLCAVAAERRREARPRQHVVWSGLPGHHHSFKETAATIRDLFSAAEHSVLISSYSLDRPEQVAKILKPLWDRMELLPALQVRLFINIPGADLKHPDQIVSRFASTFREKLWKGPRLPEVWYDPRSLEVDGPTRSCLHAKVISVDAREALVTSANISEAAHLRNIEAGALVTDPVFVRNLEGLFHELINRKDVVRLGV